MKNALGGALALAGAATLVMWPEGWSSWLLLAWLALAVGAVLVLDAFLTVPRPSTRGRRPKTWVGERVWKVDALVPLSPALAWAAEVHLREAECADGLEILFDDDEPDLALVSFLVVAVGREDAEEEARAGIRRAGLIDDGVRARRRP